MKNLPHFVLYLVLPVTCLYLCQFTPCCGQQAISPASNGTNQCKPIKFTSLFSGQIISHEGHGFAPYHSSLFCLWLLPAQPGKFIELIIVNLSLADGDCLRLTKREGNFEGHSTGGNGNASFCGTELANSSVSLQMSGSVTIEISFSSFNASHGFYIQFAYHLSRSQVCPGVNFTNSSDSSSSGLITSHPYFGPTTYSTNMTCLWSLPAQQGKFIKFSILNLSLTQSDCLKFTTNSSSSDGGNSNATYCGRLISDNFTLSMGGNVTIVFTSDGAGDMPAFLIRFEYHSVCESYPPIYATSSDDIGEILSHNGVGITNYWNNMTCNWRIHFPTGMGIRFWFTYLNISHCCDEVVVSDRLSTIVRLHGGSGFVNSPTMYQSAWNSVEVSFYSDSGSTALGFRMRYIVTTNIILNRTCNPISFTSSSNTSGRIIRHDGNDFGAPYHSNNPLCSWTLPVHSGKLIQFLIANVSLAEGDCLKLITNNNTYHNGGSGSTVYCGNSIANSTFSLQFTGTVNVQFISRNLNITKGFSLPFQYHPICGEIANASGETSSGELVSHREVGVTSYWNHMNCTWVINAADEEKVTLWFTYLDLEPRNENTSVTVYDFKDNLLVNFSGYNWSSNLSDVYQSNSGGIRVIFKSGSIATGLGFKLRYNKTLLPQGWNLCPPIISLMNSSGEIRSHLRYGSAFYPANMSCNWTLVEQPGMFVQLFIGSLSLARGDCLRILTGNSESGSPDANYCGDIANNNLSLSMGGNVNVRFVSDGVYESTGFLIQFQYRLFCEPNVDMTGESGGVIVSHSGVGVTKYWNGMSCGWNVYAPVGMRVMFWFTYLSTENGFDNVTVHEIDSDVRLLLTSGGTGPVTEAAIFKSTTSGIRVQFHSDYILPLFGFRLQYNFSQMFCDRNNIIHGGNGEVVSHKDVGLKHYDNNMYCTWKIITEPGGQISASFTFLSLMTWSDTVTLLDGIGENCIVVVRGGQSLASSIFLTRSNILTIRFSTDSRGTGLGFRLRYTSGVVVSAIDASSESTPTTWPGYVSAQTPERSVRNDSTTQKVQECSCSATTAIVIAIAIASVICLLAAGLAGYFICTRMKSSKVSPEVAGNLENTTTCNQSTSIQSSNLFNEADRTANNDLNERKVVQTEPMNSLNIAFCDYSAPLVRVYKS